MLDQFGGANTKPALEGILRRHAQFHFEGASEFSISMFVKDALAEMDRYIENQEKKKKV